MAMPCSTATSSSPATTAPGRAIDPLIQTLIKQDAQDQINTVWRQRFMFMRFQKTYLQSPGAMRSLALAAGFIALGLAGCGGGSGNAPFQATIPAPSNFRLTFDTPTYGMWTPVFRWNATPGATRYELYADPDAGGPLSEIKIGDTGKSPEEGFGYSYTCLLYTSPSPRD